MLKSLAVAALTCGLLVAAPIAPVQAASSGAMSSAHCLILPLLQPDCVEMMKSHMTGPAKAIMAPWMKSCTKAPAGSKYMYVCE